MDSIIAGTLHSSNLFAGLHEEDIKKICSHGRVDTFNKGDVIIREGQKKTCLCLLLDGRVDIILPKVSEEFERIDHVELSRKTKGDCFGEYSFLDGNPASASVVAAENCTVFAISKENFMRYLESDDFLAKKIYFNLSRIFVEKMRQVVQDSETFILV
jgi:CRP-like cAMP-binding protein